MWCVWSWAIQTQSLFCFSIQCLNYKILANFERITSLICTIFFPSLIYSLTLRLKKSGPYTRTFTMSVSKITALNSAVTTINGSLEKQSYKRAWTVVSMLWSLSSLCQSHALWSFQGMVWLCMYNVEGRITPWPAWSHTHPNSFFLRRCISTMATV